MRAIILFDELIYFLLCTKGNFPIQEPPRPRWLCLQPLQPASPLVDLEGAHIPWVALDVVERNLEGVLFQLAPHQEAGHLEDVRLYNRMFAFKKLRRSSPSCKNRLGISIFLRFKIFRKTLVIFFKLIL